MTNDFFSVQDQVVLVSGGSRGIGRAIAEGFATQGAQVVVTGREASTLNETAIQLAQGQYSVTPLVCDVASSSAVGRLMDQVLGRFGRVDTLVNVAGINRRKPVEAITEEDYDAVLGVNLRGAFLLSQSVGRHMLSREHGSQINIASLASRRPLKHAGPYAMSKAGMGQMTRSLALEWGDRGVRVNAISPGFIVTDLTRRLWSDADMRAWGEANIPQRRLGAPEDLIGTALFLASPAAAYLTGQIIYVDGGFSAGWMWPVPE